MGCCYNKNIFNHSISDFSCLYTGICTHRCLLVLAAHSQEHHLLLLRRSKSTDMFSGVYCYAVLRSKFFFFFLWCKELQNQLKIPQLQKVISESYLKDFYFKNLNHPSNCRPEFKLKANVSKADKAWISHKTNTSTDNVLQHKNKPIYSPSTPLRSVSWQNYLPARKELKSSVLFLQLSSRKPIWSALLSLPGLCFITFLRASRAISTLRNRSPCWLDSTFPVCVIAINVWRYCACEPM